MRFKEWIVGSLGAVGLILFYLIQVVIIFIPLVFLGLPWWVDAILALIVLFVPFLNTIAALAIWIWSFIIAPSDTYTPNSKLEQSNNEVYMVYITDSGTKYHRQSCQYLAHSAYCVAISYAQDHGYEPCSRCNP